MTLSNVTNGLADSCTTITARRLERFVAAEQGGECIAPTRFGGVGAWRVLSNSAVLSARLRAREAVKRCRNEPASDDAGFG